jgi:tetraacyldisaccharide 4'-kinase
MMARLYGQTVAVGADRYAAAQQLVSSEDIDVFVLDDGFQHRRLKRDIDIVLVGNEASNSLLPAGPYREPLRSVQRAHFVLATGEEKSANALLRSVDGSRLFLGALRAVALGAVESNRWVEHPLSLLFRSKILAVAGIGKAENFYRTLHEAGGEIADTIEYADHHDYSARDWQEINRAGRNVDLIVTTEKDLVKLARYPFPKDKLMALRVGMEIEDSETLLAQIIERLPVNR